MPRANKSFALQQRIDACMSKYQHPFTATNTFVDIEEMGANFSDELVPLTAIAEVIGIIISENIKTPIGSKYSHHVIPCVQGELVHRSKAMTHWAFQRNSYCGNVAKIINYWFEPCARSGKGVRLPEIYGGLVLPADSGHTSVARIIRGDEYLPFELADVPDQGNFQDTLKLAKQIAGEIFLSLNSKNVKRPTEFDIYRIAVVQQQEPQFSIHNILDPLGYKVKQNSDKNMVVHNLNDVLYLYNLGKNTKGKYLKESMSWWKKHFGDESVDPCLTASFGNLMYREDERKCSWSASDKDKLAKVIKDRWNLIEHVDDKIKAAFAEVTYDPILEKPKAMEHNDQVMLGLAYLANTYMGHNIPIPKDVDFSKAKVNVL
jgi:hypothetical protein